MFTPGQKLRDSDRAIDEFAIGRDQAYFKLAFFSGDRPGDLGQVKVSKILRFPNDDGFLLNHIWGKDVKRWGRQCVWSAEKYASENLSYSRDRALYRGNA